MDIGRIKYGFVFAFSYAALLLERFWNAFWPAVSVLLCFTGLAAGGFFTRFTGWTHVFILFTCILIFATAATRLGRRFALPSRGTTDRRIELQSGLLHRPLETLHDKPATGENSLWQHHLAQMRGVWADLKVYTPVSDAPRQDKYSLRHAAIFVFVIGMAMAGGNAGQSIHAALTPSVKISIGLASAVDVWIEPPEYTGAQPVFLSATNMSVPKAPENIRVPAGSILKIRLAGFRFEPSVSFGGNAPALSNAVRGSYTADVKLDKDGTLKISYFLIPVGKWQIGVTPDTPPEITVLMAEGTDKGTLKITYQAKDDYAIKSITGAVSAPDGGDTAYFDIPLSSLNRDAFTHNQDLSWHPLAGSFVDLTVVAEDAAGQETATKPARVYLPERVFTNPAAAAVNDARKRLILFNNRITHKLVIGILSNVVNDPRNYKGDIRVFMGLAIALKRIAYDGDQESINTVVPLLWDLALRIEDGGLSAAARELSEALQKLSKALADKNVSKEEIDRLTLEAQMKMQEYIQALIGEMQQRIAKNGPMKQMPPEIAEKIMKHLDIDKLRERLKQMSQGDSRQQMQAFADMMRESVDGFDLDAMEKAQKAQQKAVESMEKLQKLIEDQQKLFDQTNKLTPDDDKKEATAAQQKLREELGSVIRDIAALFPEVPENFGKADQAMKEAVNALQQGNTKDASGAQKAALKELQQGQDGMAQQMAEQMAQMLSMGMMPQGQKFGEGVDPLGREDEGKGMGGDVEIPEEGERRRVQEILRELRGRSNEYNRPKVERDYIDRLLDTFN